jgi:hypothetical protein
MAIASPAMSSRIEGDLATVLAVLQTGLQTPERADFLKQILP